MECARAPGRIVMAAAQLQDLMEKRLRNRVLIFLIVAGIVAFVLVRLSGRQAAAKISATIPVKENIVSSIISNGKVEPIAPYAFRAQMDTFVERVLVREGQNVKKGELLLQLDVKEAAAQLAEARTKMLKAENDLSIAKQGGRADEVAKVSSDLVKAQADLDRYQHNRAALERLVAKGAATQDEVAANDINLAKAQAEVSRLKAVKQSFEQQVQQDLRKAELEVEKAKVDVASYEDKVRQGRIVAPSDGTLYALPAKQGDYVKVGDLLGEMADLRRVRVRAFIDEPEMGALEPGEAVRITWDALPNRVWQGATEVIPKQVVARNSRSVGELLCSVENEKLELLPNVNVNVRINSKERQNVMAVPRGAVESEGAKKYVFVVKEHLGKSMLERRPIQVGIADATSYEVVSGLQPGEMVALPGDVDLRDGMIVKVVNTDTTRLKGEKNAGI